jgi:hypothetical protein
MHKSLARCGQIEKVASAVRQLASFGVNLR